MTNSSPQPWVAGEDGRFFLSFHCSGFDQRRTVAGRATFHPTTKCLPGRSKAVNKCMAIYRQPPPTFRVADHPFVAEFFASQKPLPAEYKQIAHSWMRAILTAPAWFPNPHTNSSPRTPSSVAQTQAHLCNVPAQSSATSTLSLNSPPAHQSLPPASSPGAIPQTQSASSDRPRSPLPKSLQSPRASTRRPAAIHSVL